MLSCLRKILRWVTNLKADPEWRLWRMWCFCCRLSTWPNCHAISPNVIVGLILSCPIESLTPKGVWTVLRNPLKLVWISNQVELLSGKTTILVQTKAFFFKEIRGLGQYRKRMDTQATERSLLTMGLSYGVMHEPTELYFNWMCIHENVGLRLSTSLL